MVVEARGVTLPLYNIIYLNSDTSIVMQTKDLQKGKTLAGTLERFS